MHSKANHASRWLFSIAVFIALVPNIARTASRDEEVAAVTVYKEIHPSYATYGYSVTNRSERALIGLTVGFDYYRGAPELAGAHPLSIRSPSGWEAYLISLEESNRYEVRWELIDPAAKVKPLQLLSGFLITTKDDDVGFEQSSWTVVVDGPPYHASSKLRAVQAPVAR